MKLNVVQQTQPWYAAGLKFKCTQCGNCCTGGPGYVWISDGEIDRLAKHFHLSPGGHRAILPRVGDRYSLKENRNELGQYDCIFLKELPAEPSDGQAAHSRRVCGIYEVRPTQCRTWPFWEGNLASEENWRRAAHRCPGIGRGKTHSRVKMEAQRDQG